MSDREPHPHIWYLLSVSARLGSMRLSPKTRRVTHHFDWLSVTYEQVADDEIEEQGFVGNPTKELSLSPPIDSDGGC